MSRATGQAKIAPGDVITGWPGIRVGVAVKRTRAGTVVIVGACRCEYTASFTKLRLASPTFAVDYPYERDGLALCEQLIMDGWV